MKKLLYILIAVAALYTACGEEEEPINPNAGVPNAPGDSTTVGGSNDPDSGKTPADSTIAGGDDTPTETEEPSADARLEIYQKIYAASDIYIEGDFIIIKTNGRPDHKSPYYMETEWASELHEEYDGDNDKFRLNPNRIGEFNYTFKIPLNPQEATRHQATPMGAIGVAINGVPFYNQYAAPDEPLTNEINSFDQYNGHPTGNSNYHYHIEPLYLTESKGNDVLLGFLLDGFPVYGPTEDGKLVSDNDLDEYHGHTHTTSDYPDGIYHYHITSNDPYINGNGYFGTPGTFSQ